MKPGSTKFMALFTSVQNNGVLQPIILREDRDGKFFLLKGFSRYRCAELLGMKAIPCRIMPMDDPTEARLIELQMEEDEVKFTVLLGDLLQKCNDDLTFEALSVKLGLDKGRLRELGCFRRAINLIWEGVVAGEIPLKSGLVLAKLPPMRQRKFLQLAKKLTTTQLVEQIRLRRKPPQEIKNKGMVQRGYVVPPLLRPAEEIRRALIDPHYVEAFLSFPIGKHSELVRQVVAYVFSLDNETLKHRLTKAKQSAIIDKDEVS